MGYSFNRNRKEIIFAYAKDINASYKDLGAVCDAIRYKKINDAIKVLDSIKEMPIIFRRHNKGMGSRHELGGKKGRYPIKCAGIVKKVLVNASANAVNKGFEPDAMFIVHACANKTTIAERSPSKGKLFVGKGAGGYGFVTPRVSNLEFAKVEIGVSASDKDLSEKMKKRISRNLKEVKIQKPKIAVKPEKTVAIKEVKEVKEEKPAAVKEIKEETILKEIKKEKTAVKEEKQVEQKTGSK
ncbi:MAG: 50S ribosomal protein L22 [Candidatus Marsarchaeota archaeon]|jgi:large subunit ribosomal protein L22|nr:50S ribosomal protein L22 [Candidatus Marsarchaeota archaeon]